MLGWMICWALALKRAPTEGVLPPFQALDGLSCSSISSSNMPHRKERCPKVITHNLYAFAARVAGQDLPRSASGACSLEVPKDPVLARQYQVGELRHGRSHGWPEPARHFYQPKLAWLAGRLDDTKVSGSSAGDRHLHLDRRSC